MASDRRPLSGEGTERDAARERLAAVVVTLGNTCRHLDAAELQTAVKVTHERLFLKMQ
jgi:hypothetical protein